MEQRHILSTDPAVRRFDPLGLRDRLRARGSAPPGRYQPRLIQRDGVACDVGETEMPATLRPAAVLVPIVVHDDEPTILLTRRTPHLYDHAGQISFPGGRIDGRDADARAAALRETAEETGIRQEQVEILGELDRYAVIPSRHEVTPVVGLVRPPLAVVPDPFEVSEIFEMPLAHLLRPDAVQLVDRRYQNVVRQVYVIQWLEYMIWGATAGMLVNLRDVLLSER